MALLGERLPGLLRGPIDKMLASESVRGAIERQIGRYAELRHLRCGENGGLEAALCVKGFSEVFHVRLTSVEFAPDGSHVKVTGIEADRAGIQALLEDLVQTRAFDLPEKVRPFTPMLKKLFS